ncbi:MAG: penicillin-binding transpeptidase domain-containing protein [Prevotella sp.]|nr:penicillin-binding transpeptidase domain-containing protein [Prevotella sp.]
MKRTVFVPVISAAVSALLTARLAALINDSGIAAVSAQRGTYTLKTAGEYAGIYDCNLEPLVNLSEKYEAVIIPNHISSIRIQPYLLDPERYYEGIENNLPFLCRVSEKAREFDGESIIFRSAVRTDGSQLAPHIIGYTSDGAGVCGIEKAYDDFLRSNCTYNSVTLHIDAVGEVLNGLGSQTEFAEELRCGVVTTLDKNIQQICENAADENGLSLGAIVVMDPRTGEIKASVSRPDFDASNVAAYMDDPNSPFVNRAASAYSVGSIFKLVTAAAALEQGISPEYSYTCTGSVNVNGQVFNCHKWGGHGEIDMETAMVKSCNTYFIALSEYLDKEDFIGTAEALGFGEEIPLCGDIVSAAGTLQTVRDIGVAAERANMSFGQGKLTATPMQICRMTSAIANGGVMYRPSLIKGIRDDNGTVDYSGVTAGKRVLSYETVRKLKNFMYYTVRAENSMSNPEKTIAAGKTSTAQTGRFDENGSEILNCWFTGYFPTYSPRYAVTVMSEGGVSGNVTCGPIFKQIANEIADYEKSK